MRQNALSAPHIQARSAGRPPQVAQALAFGSGVCACAGCGLVFRSVTGTVEDGIALVEYFAGHLACVLPAFGGGASPRSAGLRGRVARILEHAAGAWVDRTTISQGLGGHTPTEQITAALDALAAAGRAESRTVPTGARPREDWRALQRTYEHMNNCPDGEAEVGNCSYVHMFDTGDTAREVWEP